jgi:hypothetical protein
MATTFHLPEIPLSPATTTPGSGSGVTTPARDPGKNLTAPALVNFAPDEIGDPDLIARIALRDSSAQRMFDAGGEILGVRMAVKRSTGSVPGGVFPALLIRYNGLEVDYLVDPDMRQPVGRTVQVPSGAMINETGNRTAIEYNGTVLFTFDPVGASP